jgi:hypothetical protein
MLVVCRQTRTRSATTERPYVPALELRPSLDAPRDGLVLRPSAFGVALATCFVPSLWNYRASAVEISASVLLCRGRCERKDEAPRLLRALRHDARPVGTARPRMGVRSTATHRRTAMPNFVPLTHIFLTRSDTRSPVERRGSPRRSGFRDRLRSRRGGGAPTPKGGFTKFPTMRNAPRPRRITPSCTRWDKRQWPVELIHVHGRRPLLAAFNSASAV